jgi:hypothetical protein
MQRRRKQANSRNRSTRTGQSSRFATWVPPLTARMPRLPIQRSRRIWSVASTALPKLFSACRMTIAWTCGPSAAHCMSYIPERSFSRATATTRCSKPLWRFEVASRRSCTSGDSCPGSISTKRDNSSVSSVTRSWERYVFAGNLLLLPLFPRDAHTKVPFARRCRSFAARDLPGVGISIVHDMRLFQFPIVDFQIPMFLGETASQEKYVHLLGRVSQFWAALQVRPTGHGRDPSICTSDHRGRR